jgi:hypothetical protein
MNCPIGQEVKVLQENGILAKRPLRPINPVKTCD